mgnify:CR=1 FL=1
MTDENSGKSRIACKQIFNAIEAEVINLAYHISLEEGLKKVYSPHIAELQLRIYAQIEFLLKDIYADVSHGKGKVNPKYDEDCIPKLALKNKYVYLHWDMCKFKKRLYRPFCKSEERIRCIEENGSPRLEAGGKKNYRWNNAYQNLRHDFGASLCYFGTLEYLFEGLSAMTVLMEDSNHIFSIVEIAIDKNTGEKKAFGWVPGSSAIRKSWDI